MTKIPSVADAKPVAPLPVPPLAADLDVGFHRLKLAAVRRSAPEVLLYRGLADNTVACHW